MREFGPESSLSHRPQALGWGGRACPVKANERYRWSALILIFYAPITIVHGTARLCRFMDLPTIREIGNPCYRLALFC